MSRADDAEQDFPEEDDLDIRKAYPLMDAVAQTEGWNDSVMKSYNVYARPPAVTAEITYDLIMKDDMTFVEGCYRLPGAQWCVFIFSTNRRTDTVTWQFCKWDSGGEGVAFHVPPCGKLNKERVQALLSRVLGVEAWSEVKGPDSIVLR